MTKNFSEQSKNEFEDLFVFTARLEAQLGREVSPEEVSYFQQVAEIENLRHCLSEGLRTAQDTWNYEVPDDYEFAQSFDLISVEYEFLLDWISNQRDYERLAKLGIDEWDANHLAKYDRTHLRRIKLELTSASQTSLVTSESYAIDVEVLSDAENIFPPAPIVSPVTDVSMMDRQNATAPSKMRSKSLRKASRSGELDSEITFGQAYQMFMDLYARPHLTAAGCGTYSNFYRRYLKHFSHRPLSDIKKLNVLALHVRIGEKHGRRAANHALETMRVIYNKMIEWDVYAGLNPASKFKAFSKVQKDRFLQPSELKIFFESVSALRSVDAQNFFLLALYTGVRKSNLLSMSWSDVNLDDCTWKIAKTKNGRPQTVALVPAAVEILEKRKRNRHHSDYVFPSTNGSSVSKSGRFENVYKSWRRLKEKAGFNENLTVHDLRRSLASWEAITGANLTVIGATLNHTDPKSTAIYARMNLDPVRKAMETAVDTMLKVGKQVENLDS
ncbi:MAG: site-specific integrase [Candidatus Melainabacteria bacterium]|nr:site-specific integrase [Candidatus Melainabacteria bacterium]